MNYNSIRAADRFLLSLASELDQGIYLGPQPFDIEKIQFLNQERLDLLNQMTMTDKMKLTSIFSEFWRIIERPKPIIGFEDITEWGINGAIEYLFREQFAFQATWMSKKSDSYKDDELSKTIKENNSEYQLTLETYWIENPNW